MEVCLSGISNEVASTLWCIWGDLWERAGCMTEGPQEVVEGESLSRAAGAATVFGAVGRLLASLPAGPGWRGQAARSAGC